jgi:hypothetical protein
MTFLLVPLSLMAQSLTAAARQSRASVSIHLFLLGLPIALIASRVGVPVTGARPHGQTS